MTRVLVCGGRHFNDGDAIILEQIAEIRRLRTANEELVGALKECADDLASDLDARYPARYRDNVPSEARRYHRDMAPVTRARAILSRNEKETT